MHLKVNSPDCVQVIFFLSQVIFSVQIECLFLQVLYFLYLLLVQPAGSCCVNEACFCKCHLFAQAIRTQYCRNMYLL